MIYYTKHAEKKFEILNRHGVFITREQVEDTLNYPDKIISKGRYIKATKEDIAVIYETIDNIKRVMTFFPI